MEKVKLISLKPQAQRPSNLQPKLPLNLQIINPITYPNWNDLVLSHPNYSFFHSSNWARVLAESYDYSPRYFTVMEGDKLSCLVPLMEVKSYLTGKRGVSLPFSDYCAPFIPGDINFQNILEKIIEFGRRSKWRSLEIRGGEHLLKNTPCYSYFYEHKLNLNQNENQILSNMRSSTRRNIKKSEISGVRVSMRNNIDDLKAFYRLHCITRKNHGLPPQPYFFFQKIYDHSIKKGLGNIIIARHEENTVAGAILFHFGKKALYKYGALDRRYQHLRASNLVMWEGIKWYLQNGYESLNFGRTEPEHAGLRQFKMGWGTEERIIKYYKYDIQKQCFVKKYPRATNVKKRIFIKMPIPILKTIGSALYRHMG